MFQATAGFDFFNVPDLFTGKLNDKSTRNMNDDTFSQGLKAYFAELNTKI